MYELKDGKIKERRHVKNGRKHWDDHKYCLNIKSTNGIWQCTMDRVDMCVVYTVDIIVILHSEIIITSL